MGDCLEVMSQLQEKFDLCLTDAPYGIGEAAGKNKSRGKLGIAKDYGNLSWDNKIPSKVIFEWIFRLSENQIIFGGNYFIEYLKNSPCWLVWDKDNSGNFADAELIYTSFKTAVRIFKFRWNGMLQQDMKHKEKRYHPTQKPIRLIENILSKYSEPEQSIIDPFLGSGTTAVACENLGRRWVGIEREEKYCEIAARRIEEAANQMSF
jgi:DNA modification methylase